MKSLVFLVKYRISKSGSFYWGRVVFTNKEAANKALEEYGSIKDEDDIQI